MAIPEPYLRIGPNTEPHCRQPDMLRVTVGGGCFWPYVWSIETWGPEGDEGGSWSLARFILAGHRYRCGCDLFTELEQRVGMGSNDIAQYAVGNPPQFGLHGWLWMPDPDLPRAVRTALILRPPLTRDVPRPCPCPQHDATIAALTALRDQENDGRA